MTVVISVDILQGFIASLFLKAGCAAPEAAQIAHYLLSANLTGHDSHGVIRVPRYIQWLREGKVLAGQTLTVVSDTPTHAIVDGNYGFGQIITPLAVDMGIAKAQKSGLAVIGLRHSGHLGRVGDWAERAAVAGLVSLHFVNVGGGEIVAPFGGVDRRFATNPICIGAPLPGGPLILDFATSLVAEGKVLVAANGGAKVPDDALITPDGHQNGDPRTLYGEIAGTHVRDPANGHGALRTFGEHKGSGLAFMCEMLAACLTGGPTSGPVPNGKRERICNSMLSFYVSPTHLGAAGFAAQLQGYAEYVKASRPAEPGGAVLLPGEKEARTRAERSRNGIPLQQETWNALLATASALGVTEPA